jgi:aspartyl aminopeptidase
MKTYVIVKREYQYGLAKKLNAMGVSTSQVVDTVKGTLEDAGRALLDRLRDNELRVDGDTYYTQVKGEFIPAFTVGQDHCEVDELWSEFTIAEA